jgi:CAI-1 autoinducer synthase
MYNINPNQYPIFLRQKLKAFYVDRFHHEWNGQHIMRGKKMGPKSIQLMSNDYLSIVSSRNDSAFNNCSNLNSGDDSLLMSSIFLQEDSPQALFEAKMADFMRSDEVILCQSGYAANVGLIQSIVEGTNTPVYVDRMAHMSLWDGAAMAKTRVIPFRHNDVTNMQQLIELHGPGLVIVDSVYSTDGSICPLPDLVNVAFNLECILLVDESHSLGTHGPQGSGLVVKYGLENKVMFRSASLAKAFACRAGLITCPQDFSDFFKFTSKPSIFSSSLLPHEIVTLDKTLGIIKDADILRMRLKNNTAYLRNALNKLGYNVTLGDAQIIALESGTERNTIALRDALEKRGIFGSVFCAPATAKNRAIIRLSINSTLTKAQLNRIVNACAEIVDELDVPNWKSSLRKRPVSYADSLKQPLKNGLCQ